MANFFCDDMKYFFCDARFTFVIVPHVLRAVPMNYDGTKCVL